MIWVRHEELFGFDQVFRLSRALLGTSFPQASSAKQIHVVSFDSIPDVLVAPGYPDMIAFSGDGKGDFS